MSIHFKDILGHKHTITTSEPHNETCATVCVCVCSNFLMTYIFALIPVPSALATI